MTTSKVRFDSYIFNGCSAIIGQSGVAYDSTKTNVSMANYETGYLTYKGSAMICKIILQKQL